MTTTAMTIAAKTTTVMQTIETRICTERSTFYINLMSRHFSHKIDAQWDDNESHMPFSIGQCVLKNEGDKLHIACQASDVEQLTQLMDVIKSHFDRFAYKDSLILHWPDLSSNVSA